MVDTEERVIESPYSLERWLTFKKSKNKSHCFLFFLSPIMEHIYQTCCDQILASNHLHKIICQSVLLNVLQKQFKDVFSRIILKCALWEMHVAKEHELLTEETSEERFNEFIEMMSTVSFIHYFFEKYPIMKEVIDNKVAAISSAWQQFFSRLDDDWVRIKDIFFKSHTDFSLVDIEVTGDTHCFGQTTMRLKFKSNQSDDLSVMYKPRDLTVDCAYNQLLDWYNSYNDLQLKSFIVLKRSGYGWCEFLRHKTCESIEAIERFYHRQGALLAILYCINGTDIHFENLIAHGEYPIIVDLESLFRPDVEGWYKTPPSVFDTHLLPMRVDIDGFVAGWDLGGLNGEGDGKLLDFGIEVKKSGTDEMFIERVDLHVKHKANNKPTYLGELFSDSDFSCEAVVSGFSKSYRFIMAHKKLLCSDNSPIQHFLDAKTRLIFRPTSLYSSLLGDSFHPDFMESESVWRNHFQVLEGDTNDVLCDYLFDSEKRDLKFCDIPYFSYDVSSNTIYDAHDEKIDLVVNRSGLDAVKERITGLSDEDLALQVYIIRGAYVAYGMSRNTKHAIPQNLEQYPALQFKKFSSVSDVALKKALSILENMYKLKIEHNGTFSWPTLNFQTKNDLQVYSIDLANHNFLMGSFGIMLPFAVASYFFAEHQYHDFVQGYIDNLPYFYETNLNHFNLVDRAFNIYGLNLMAQYDFEVNPIVYNLLYSDLEKLIEQDKQYDFLTGCASLMGITQDVKLLEVLADHFLKGYPDPRVKPKTLAIETVNDASMLGYAHGVSGINVALARANKQLNSVKIDQWIEGALNYLDEIYDKHGHWADMRNPTPKRTSQWCHGATGIGAGYLSLGKIYSTEQISKGLARAVDQVRLFCDAFTPELLGHYCCGYLGAHSFLMDVSLEHPDLISNQDLEHEHMRLLSCMDQYGTKIFGIGNGYNLGLLYGISGLTYQLLRIAKPDIRSFLLALAT